MSLQELLNDNKISKVDNVSIREVMTIFSQGVRFFNDAKKSLSYKGDDTVNYTKVYDAVRIAGESLLLLRGYRIKKGEGRHYRAIEAMREIINGELSRELKSIERMRIKRNRIEYGASEISKNELIEAIKNVEIVLVKIQDIIKRKNPQKTLI